MEKPADIESTGNRVHTKPGETRPNWPRSWRKKNSFKTSIAVALYGFEYATGWYYYLYGNIASFRFLLQLSAVMLFAFGVYGVTMDMEKRPIDRGVREATLFAMIARAYALPEGKGARALKAGVEALARDGVAMKEIDLSGADLRGAILAGADLRRANLENAILIEADLSGADLFGANLSGAVFTRANPQEGESVRVEPRRFRPRGRGSSRGRSGASQSSGRGAARCELLEYADGGGDHNLGKRRICRFFWSRSVRHQLQRDGASGGAVRRGRHRRGPAQSGVRPLGFSDRCGLRPVGCPSNIAGSHRMDRPTVLNGTKIELSEPPRLRAWAVW